MKKAEMCYPGNVDEVIFTCIKKWLNGSTGSPVTWEFLLRILEESELKEPSAQLKAKLLTLKGQNESISGSDVEADGQLPTSCAVLSDSVTFLNLKLPKPTCAQCFWIFILIISLLMLFCGVYMMELYQLWAQNNKLMLENKNLSKQLEVLASNNDELMSENKNLSKQLEVLASNLRAQNDKLMLEKEDLIKFIASYSLSHKFRISVSKEQIDGLQKKILNHFELFKNEALRLMNVNEQGLKLHLQQLLITSEQLLQQKYIQETSDWQLFQSDQLDKCRLHSFKLPNLPIATSDATAVTIGHRIYVGGGTMKDKTRVDIIQVYDINTGKWGELPPAPQYCFEMVSLNGSLMLLGGFKKYLGKATGMVSVWQVNEAQWTQAIPSMKVGRWRPGVLVLENSVLVCGGAKKYMEEMLNSCEVLDFSTNQWKIMTVTLPEPLFAPTLGVFGDTVILTFGLVDPLNPSNKSWSIPQTSFFSTSNKTLQWARLANTPTYLSSLLLNSKQPVLISGFRPHEMTKAIYFYKLDQWECVGKLVASSPLMRPAVTAIGSNSFLVVGGSTNISNYDESLVDSVELITCT
jgi:cell division protein FtsB